MNAGTTTPRDLNVDSSTEYLDTKPDDESNEQKSDDKKKEMRGKPIIISSEAVQLKLNFGGSNIEISELNDWKLNENIAKRDIGKFRNLIF